MCVQCFFFNDTATTEINTYGQHSFPTRRSSDLAATKRSWRKPPPQSSAPPSATRWAGSWRTRWRSWAIAARGRRSEEHTSELQSLMRISYAVFCLKKKIQTYTHRTQTRQ